MNIQKTTNGSCGDTGIDIDALLRVKVPGPDLEYRQTLANEVDRQLAREVARMTGQTTLILMGRLGEPRCLPAECERMCPSFKLISMRKIDGSHIAIFSVPIEREMAELFEEIDGRRGLRAIAFDSNGRTKEAYVL